MEEKCALPQKKGLSDLIKNEDWLAVWIGFLLIALALASQQWKLLDLTKVTPSFKWATDSQIESRTENWAVTADALVKDAEGREEMGTVKRLNALKETLAKKDRGEILKAAEKVSPIGGLPGALAKEIAGHSKGVPGNIFTWDNISRSIQIGVVFLIIATVGLVLMGGVPLGKFIIGFPIIFLLAWFSRFLAGNAIPVDWGFEYVVFCLIVGLLISNTVGVPEWLMPAVRTEYYIKSGLVILGAGILFFEILQGGALGIIQGVLVVAAVWYFCFWLATKILKVDDDFAAMLSSGVAICGVSAAIATCGAIEGDKKKLSYVASLVLIVAVPMMVIEPWVIKYFGIPELVGGAWIGGTLDTSGSVVAAGALVGEAAMKTGVIVKFSQNVLIGVAAFVLSILWTVKKGAATGQKATVGIIWERFPKFVLGFIVASTVFSFMLHIDTVSATKGILGELRTWWFALAFMSIGLETNFGDIARMEGGRPALAFITAQAFNVVWTLILAYLLFGGYIFPIPDIR
ncbi:MAG: putative sulfate exporter family transporter [Nitrospiraceae bacterium]|nr:MAG: putative sulfate exporter family transporter [Nitrospiraceae bacterium]